MYAVWSNAGEGVRGPSAATASTEDASTAQTHAARRKLRRDTCDRSDESAMENGSGTFT